MEYFGDDYIGAMLRSERIVRKLKDKSEEKHREKCAINRKKRKLKKNEKHYVRKRK